MMEFNLDFLKQHVLSPITRRITYASNCKSNVQFLLKVVEHLKNQKHMLEEDVDEAKRSGDEIYAAVLRWLRDADNAIGEAEELLRQKDEAKMKCLFGFCPDLKMRYQLSKIADERASAVIQLHNDGRLDMISYSPASNYSSELLPSRVLMLEKIMDALKDPSLNMIRIYGPGGVGKTTLVKEVCAQARKQELFDVVIMVSVSRFPNMRRMQAEFLGLESSQLYQRSKKGKVLIILDDVWQKLDLHALGIPFRDECQGCKLLVSSRRKDVLATGIGSQKDFLVGVLSKEESQSLFQTVVPKVEDERLNAIAVEIVKRCAGLPLLIMLVSVHLKNKELYAWVDMLKQLSMFGNGDFHERVHKVVESSFENLPGEEKSLFLLFASFAQSNIRIQRLLFYGMGLRLFRNVNTLQEARDRLFSLIRKLKNKWFLMDGDLDEHVKMHSVVHDAAISIASRFQNSFMGASETRLRDWPSKDCTRVSLSICNIQELHEGLQCPKAELFQLSSEDFCLEITHSFFYGITKLKVVDFTGIYFPTGLPLSLGCHKNLHTLLLHRCGLENISVIGELTKLEYLSFAGSDIVELPGEIEALTQLKLLDLTNCSKLQVIPSNVISKLILLEELYMCNSCVRWDEEGNVSLLELEKLSYLSSLEIQIVNPKSIPKFSSFYDGLGCYTIIVGKEQGWWENYEKTRMLKLIKLEESIHLNTFEFLFRGVEYLYLDEVNRMRISLDDLTNLRHLCIKNDYRIQNLMKCLNGYSLIALPELESLCLDNLNNLEMISNLPLIMGSFGKLRFLKISDCGELKSLFSFSCAKCLWELQELEVESCENMEVIFSEGIEKMEFTRVSSLKLKNLPHFKGFSKEKEKIEKVEPLFNDMITFPKLTSLEVKKCKSLKHVFTRSYAKWLQQLKRLKIDDCVSVEEIIWHKESEEGIDKIVFPNLNYVSLKQLQNLKRFSGENTISEGDELFGENITSYYLIGESFPRLTHLHIRNGYGSQHTLNLHGLNSLESLHFQNMRSLNASDCNSLKNLFSFASAICSMQILEMEVRSCHKMEAIVGGRSGDAMVEWTQLRSMKMGNLPHLMGFCEGNEEARLKKVLFNEMVSFPNLTSLVVETCNSLKYVFTMSMVKCLPQLKKLEISNCELVEAIVQSSITEENEDEIGDVIVFHKLDSLSLSGLPNVKMFGHGCKIEFPFLREFSIECSAMENFVSRISGRNNSYNDTGYLFNEQITFSNLESMIVRNMDTFRYLWNEKFILNNFFFKLKSLNIVNCSRLSVVLPENAVKRFQKLEVLYLSGCDAVEEIFQSEENGFGEIKVAEEFALRDMQIMNLASLKYVFPNTMAHSLSKLELLEIDNCNVQEIVEEEKDGKAQAITCFEDTSLQRVEMLREMEVYSNKVIEFPQLLSLKLRKLPHLTGLCNKLDRGFGVQVSLPILKSLELRECKSLKYVFTTTLVNRLAQLERLEINNCELVEEIVLSRQFDEIDDTERNEKLVFPKLEYFLLEGLPNLKTFDFGFPVEFQSLKELSISHCPVLKNFVSKYVGYESDECLFNEKVTFSNLENMKVCHANNFKYLWDEQFTADGSFLKLKSLRIEYCLKLSVVFPANVYTRFQGLEILHLCCCSRVEEIYQCEGTNFEALNTVQAFSLQDLELWNLPSLRYIWSKDAAGASTFEYLRSVKVFSCKDLVFVFPKSIACRLPQLQHLKIGNSDVEFIIDNTNAKNSNFTVPQLAVLQLENLYQMRNICDGPYTFECPKLKQFDMYGCNQEMNFHSEIRSLQLCGFDRVLKLSSNIESLPFIRKEFFRNLEELTLDGQVLRLIKSVKSGVKFFKLKTVTLRSLEEESIPVLIDFLSQWSLEKLVVVESYLEEFLLDEREAFPNNLRLKHLELVGDDNLKHILKKHAGVNPVLKDLLTLNVEFYESLINIAPSAASFKNLTSLNISFCFKMINLVTVETAETMTNLVELKVSECYMMEEVIVESDGMQDLWIGFYNLKCLELHGLPKLNSFSSRNNFIFPSLERFTVKKCFAMKNFCSREVSTPKLQSVHFEDEQHWEGDINATIASRVRVTNSHSWTT